MELITVIITTHNRDIDLERAIKSVFNQSYKNLELFVVDDNPTISTGIVVEKFKNQLSYIKSSKKGLCSSRNLGLEISNGDFVVFLDDDDEILRDSILKRKIFLDSLEENIKSNTAYVYSGCSLNIVHQKRTTFDMPFIHGDLADSIKNGKIKTIPSTFLINKVVLDKYNIRFDESFTSFVDHDFFMNLASNNLHIYFVNEALTKTYVFPTKKSMVNDVDKRLDNIQKFFSKWNKTFDDLMNVTNYKKFKTNYISNEFSSLILNSIIANDLKSFFRIIFEISLHKKSTRNLSLMILKITVLNFIKHLIPSSLIRIFKN